MTLQLKNKRFGRLTAITQTHQRSGKSIIWTCKCDCGMLVDVASRDLIHSRRVAHPGCPLTPTNNPLYQTYAGMIDRCTNPKSPSWKNYGGRGITVCRSWLQHFNNFLQDMGDKPQGDYSLDRINVNGPYSPENCRWADSSTQGQNTRKAESILSYDQFIYIFLTPATNEQLASDYNIAPGTVKNIKCLDGPYKDYVLKALNVATVQEAKRLKLLTKMGRINPQQIIANRACA